MTPAPPRTRSRVAAPARIARLLLCVAVLADPALAQQGRPGLFAGRLRAQDGTAVDAAVLRATRGPRTVIAYSERDGDFRLGGLGAGRWTIAVRKLGFRPLVFDIDMPEEGLRRDVMLERAVPQDDSALAAASWVGVRGIVGDARRESPLAGASVLLLGSDANATTDSAGMFAIPLARGRELALRVERGGYVSRVVSAVVPDGGYALLEIQLDTSLSPSLDGWMLRDLNARLKYATPRAALVGSRELQATNAPNLWAALERAPTVIRQRVVITRAACIFVDGIPRPGIPVDALFTSDAEFVEVYPPGSELTMTLQRAWPQGAQCGVRDNSALRYGNSRQVAQFIAVWSRVP